MHVLQSVGILAKLAASVAGRFRCQLEILVRRHGVRMVWLADENFAADREAAPAPRKAGVANAAGFESERRARG